LAGLIVWLAPTVLALLRLRRVGLDETPRVLWAVVIAVLPLMAVLAFLLVSPGTRRSGKG
jgi:hypothetical protein